MPLARPRSAGSYISASSAKPTTHVTASAAPWASRATKSAGSVSAYASISVAITRPTRPPTSGPLRPIRSDTAPTGIATHSAVTPKDANNNPTIVGDAPSFRVRSGSTGTATE